MAILDTTLFQIAILLDLYVAGLIIKKSTISQIKKYILTIDYRGTLLEQLPLNYSSDPNKNMFNNLRTDVDGKVINVYTNIIEYRPPTTNNIIKR